MTERKSIFPEAQASWREKCKIPFPQAGEGAHLFFRTSDLVTLETAHAAKFGRGDTMFSYLERNVLSGHAGVMVDCLEAGLKTFDAEGKPVALKLDFEDLPFAPAEAAEPIIRALAPAVYGETLEDLAARAAKDREEMRKAREGAV